MKKTIIAVFFAAATVIGFSSAVSASDVKAERTSEPVYVNGEHQYFTAYNIDGNNYFKLRDIAYVLSGSEKQFDVSWDEKTNAIIITSNAAYTPVGGEMEAEYYLFYKPEITAVPSDVTIYLDKKEITLDAYNINGNNYFKLRNLGEAVDFSVEWDNVRNDIYIETAYRYMPDDIENSYELSRSNSVADTNVQYISNWTHVSSVQQFSYKDEGLAYAFVNNDMLEIVTPSQRLSLSMRYPVLGDVISDDKGNFYVVWGKANESSENDIETVFISKYSPDGKHEKSTGFVGESVMGANGNTKIPFEAGNCTSAIGNDYLMVNYARKMYNGHQSNNVIGVRLSDMTPAKLDDRVWTVPYTSHSFDQDILWDDTISQFIFADQGDAYDRGFIIHDNNSEKNIFHFYLPANSNYNMGIVNRTFAQLGGLVKTSKGVAFVGASAMSISGDAEKEPQNLFVQVFDPKKKLSKEMFIGGEERTGQMSFDINDNSNSPLESVTDYGVHWLTKYTDKDVVAPHTVAADDNIVVLWNEKEDSAVKAYYMVLSASGDEIRSKTLIGNIALNPCEAPVYHEGKVYWASANKRVIRVMSIEV